MDYVSEYPSVMYQYSLSPENLQRDGAVVMNIDDETIPITYRFNVEHGVLDRTVRGIFNKRIDYKRLMKEALKLNDAVEHKRLDRL